MPFNQTQHYVKRMLLLSKDTWNERRIKAKKVLQKRLKQCFSNNEKASLKLLIVSPAQRMNGTKYKAFCLQQTIQQNSFAYCTAFHSVACSIKRVNSMYLFILSNIMENDNVSYLILNIVSIETHSHPVLAKLM